MKNSIKFGDTTYNHYPTPSAAVRGAKQWSQTMRQTVLVLQDGQPIGRVDYADNTEPVYVRTPEGNAK